jgi:eukaryotic-like serine/threonine-protein kinase
VWASGQGRGAESRLGLCDHSPMSLQPGEAVDRFLVERMLGEGGMATVYLVEHNLLGSQHALKVLLPELVGDPRIRERFLAEGRIQAQLQHPNVARVTDIVAIEGLAALVMEYVEGPTLGELIEQRGALPAAEILAVFLPVLDAIAAAHAKGILHRDLKPSNIVIGSDGSGGVRPVVLDFGIARVSDEADEGLKLKQRTRDGAQIGTPAWMSPEQVRGRQDLDERSDVFSLGAILYELATGSMAFEGDSEFDTMNNVVTGTWDGPIAPIPGDERGTISACISQALATDREDRFQSVDAFRAALIEAAAPLLDPTPTDELDSITAVGDPVTVSQPFAPAPQRPLPPPAAQPAPPAPTEPTHSPRASMNRRAVLAFVVLSLVVLAAAGGWIAIEKRATRVARQAEEASREAANRSLAMLENRQTDPAANADEALLGTALATAAKGVSTSRTPEALSAHALLKVLHDGWHLRGRTWDEDAFADVESLTRGALGASSSVEAELARAVLTARACRLLDAADPRQDGFCGEAEQRFERLRPAVAADKRAWLRVEHAWISVGFLSALAETAQGSGVDPRRRALGARGVVTCDGVLDLPKGTAVNEGILPGACLTAAGHAGDYAAYYRYARRLRADDEGPDGKLLSSNVRLIYESAGPTVCRDMKFNKNNEYKRTMPASGGADELFCGVIGLYALDCPLQAAKFSLLGKLLHNDAGLAWAEPSTSFHFEDKRSCYLSADVGD